MLTKTNAKSHSIQNDPINCIEKDPQPQNITLGKVVDRLYLVFGVSDAVCMLVTKLPVGQNRLFVG